MSLVAYLITMLFIGPSFSRPREYLFSEGKTPESESYVLPRAEYHSRESDYPPVDTDVYTMGYS